MAKAERGFKKSRKKDIKGLLRRATSSNSDYYAAAAIVSDGDIMHHNEILKEAESVWEIGLHLGLSRNCPEEQFVNKIQKIVRQRNRRM